MCYQGEDDPSGEPTVSQVVAELAEWLGWSVAGEALSGSARRVTLLIPSAGPTLLVIDDSEELIYLVQRFLVDERCRVVATSDPQEGLHLAQALNPDAVLLDVMMPEMDGWEVLQRLQANPETVSTPVIVCSVIDDPELARALGASVFLPKPVDHNDILSSLRHLGIL